MLTIASASELWPHAEDDQARQRFAEKVSIGAPDECWLWRAGLGTNGYGRFRLGKHKQAHRVSFEWARHRIPDGLQLDHLCRVRNCVNPNHLEPVTSRENTLRGETLAAECASKTHCPQGHPYDDQNTLQESGGRYRRCRSCARERDRARRLDPKRMAYMAAYNAARRKHPAIK